MELMTTKYRPISFHARITFLKKSCKLNTKLPLTIVYFVGFRGLTTSSYTVYNYTTSGQMDL